MSTIKDNTVKDNSIKDKTIAIKEPNPKPIRKKTKKQYLIEKEGKILHYRDAYAEFFTHRLIPVSEGFLNKIGMELIEYVEDPDIEILRIEWFFTKRRILPDLARDWASKYSDFGKIYNACKKIIGMRREDGALRHGWNASVAMATMPMFDDEYKALKEWEAKMKSDADGNSGKVLVLMDSFKKDKEQYGMD